MNRVFDEDDCNAGEIDKESLVKNVNNRLQRPYNIGVIQCDQNNSKLIFLRNYLMNSGMVLIRLTLR